MSRIAFERGERSWKIGRTGSGLCFTVSWDRFEEILQTGMIPEAFPAWHLAGEYRVERYEIGTDGVTVFIEKNND